MTPTISLGRLAGIPVGLHYSHFVLLILVTWRIATGFLIDSYPGWSPWAYWATAVGAVVLLSVSILIHELAHSLVARARGIVVYGITMFILGGVSDLEADSKRARDEFFIAIVGPATSFLISAVLWGVTRALSGGDLPMNAIILYLSIVNLLLGIFNLLPVFPLDGGRLFRSMIWAVSGSHAGATRVAVLLGRTMAIGLIVLGVYQFVIGNFLGAVWLVFVGWFVQKAARRSQSDVQGAD